MKERSTCRGKLPAVPAHAHINIAEGMPTDDAECTDTFYDVSAFMDCPARDRYSSRYRPKRPLL